MKLRTRRVAVVVVTGLAAATFGAVDVGLAAASGGVPWTDPNQHGTLTFCGRDGKPVTSGSLYTRPFAWKTMASAEAPTGYRASTARATLYIYQPIQYVDPGDWSGGQMTGSSSFSNASHPNVQATNGDQSIFGFTNAYPSHWAHLYQIRMFFSAPNAPQQTATYPAAVIKVTGKNWQLVQGGGTSCTAGHGVSNEVLLLPKKEQNKALKHPHNSLPTGVTATSATSTGSGNGNGSATSASGSGQPTNAASSASSGSSSGGLSTGAKTAIGLGVVALATVVGAVFGARRRSGPAA